jgi:hypothetical protein
MKQNQTYKGEDELLMASTKAPHDEVSFMSGTACYKRRMRKVNFLAGCALLLAACADSPSFTTEAECSRSPIQRGDTDFCGYYPGYGWARVPVATSIRTN